MREVLLQRLAVLDRYRCDAGEALELLHALQQRHLLAELWIVDEIERDLPVLMAAETGQPLVDIGCVADLAELAVADDIDAELTLLLDRICNCLADYTLE